MMQDMMTENKTKPTIVKEYTWNFRYSWHEAGPLNYFGDAVDSDQ